MTRRKPRKYHVGDAGGTINASDLRRADRDTQIRVMRDWFLSNYTDPVENTPYESAEGGYIYIWGGPFDPYEELETEFSGVVRDKVIEDLANELSSITTEWTGNPDNSDVDEYEFDVIAAFPGHLGFLRKSLIDIEGLLEAKINPDLEQRFRRLLYANIITALETYLSDFFISAITNDRTLLRKFVETTEEFKREKIALSEIFQASEQIDQKVKTHLTGLVWHKLNRIKDMFRDTLGLDLPDASELFKALLVRHDLVHRDGKTRDGGEHSLTDGDVRKLVASVDAFVSAIDREWERLKLPPPPPDEPIEI